MTVASDTTNMSFRVNRNLKQQADTLFRNLGMNTSVALNMFLSQSVHDQAMPFRPRIERIPSKELLAALNEAKDIADGKIETKKYQNFNELLADLDND